MDLDKPLLLIQKQQKPKEVNEKDTTSVGQSSGKGKGKHTEYDMDRDDWNRRSSFSSMPPSSPPRHNGGDAMTLNTSDNGPTVAANTRGENDPMAPAGGEETMQYNRIAIIR